jgi:PilZ domain
MGEQTIPSQTEHPVAPRTERRAWVRFPSDQEISCEPVGANAFWLGRVRDASRGGIALIVPRQFHPGTILSVELLLIKADGPRRLVVRVVRARQETNGWWLIGCAFARPLSEQQLQAFLEE